MTKEAKNKKNGSQDTKAKNTGADAKFDFKTAIESLEKINKWFQQPDIDLDEGLEKLKEGKRLIAACEERLAEAENEFEKIKDDLDEETVPGNTSSKDAKETHQDINSPEDILNDPDLFGDDLFDIED